MKNLRLNSHIRLFLTDDGFNTVIGYEVDVALLTWVLRDDWQKFYPNIQLPDYAKLLPAREFRRQLEKIGFIN